LQRLYGDAASLRIFANHQHGTTIELRIPVAIMASSASGAA
jgi:hypothetical protein